MIAGALAFLLLVALASLTGRIPLFVMLSYLCVSAVTFLVYWFDKSAARAGADRVSENNLHLLALAGGWPGAMLAQQLLRH